MASVSRHVFAVTLATAVATTAVPLPARAADPEEHPHTNRLIHEKSPYLLQHAHNPVDWHPWGEEALEKALRENKLVFLSIGYSTCHWCHVMETESFDVHFHHFFRVIPVVCLP